MKKQYVISGLHITAYEDGMFICRFDCHHRQAFNQMLFALESLGYREIKSKKLVRKR